jgi:hypothetical protein
VSNHTRRRPYYWKVGDGLEFNSLVQSRSSHPSGIPMIDDYMYCDEGDIVVVYHKSRLFTTVLVGEAKVLFHNEELRGCVSIMKAKSVQS